jgi:hypothetical protein
VVSPPHQSCEWDTALTGHCCRYSCWSHHSVGFVDDLHVADSSWKSPWLRSGGPGIDTALIRVGRADREQT